jgi:hypothetical protein
MMRWLMNNKLKRVRKWHYPGIWLEKLSKTMKNPRISGSWPEIWTREIQIRSRNANHSAVTFGDCWQGVVFQAWKLGVGLTIFQRKIFCVSSFLRASVLAMLQLRILLPQYWLYFITSYSSSWPIMMPFSAVLWKRSLIMTPHVPRRVLQSRARSMRIISTGSFKMIKTITVDCI